MRKFIVSIILFLGILSFSVVQVGVLYSKTAENYYTMSSYKTILDGLEKALQWGNIEYEIIDSSIDKIPDNIKVLIDPSNAALKDSEVKLVEKFLLNGGKIIAAYESSLRFSDGKLRNNYVYGDYLDVSFKSWQSGGYNYLNLTEEGKKIFGINKDYIRLPRGFTFVFDTTATPLALWTKDTNGTLTNKDYPVAAALSNFGIFFGENIYLHTESDEVKLLIVNSVRHLINMPGNNIDFTEIEKRKLKSEIGALEILLQNEGYKLNDNELKEIQNNISVIQNNLESISDINEIEKAKKIIKLSQLKLEESHFVETRAIWLDHGAIERTGSPEKLRETLRKLNDLGFNLVIPEVIYKGYSISPELSHYPQDESFRDWKEDPLEVIIDESKKLGMEVHAWCWVFAVSSASKYSKIMEDHPEWIEKDKYGNVFMEEHQIAWLSHANPEAREYIMDGILEIVKKYDVDGINLDYIRYASDEMGYDDFSIQEFKRETGIDPYEVEKYSEAEVKWHMWREEKVSSFVREFYKKAKDIKKDILISADVYPSLSGGRLNKKQNWEEWIRNGYIDIVIPMDYRSGIDDLKILLDDQKKYKNMVYILPGLQMITLSETEDLVQQISTARNYIGYGVVLFALAYVDKYDFDYLKYGLFRNKAVPVHADLSDIKNGFEKELNLKLNMCKKFGISDENYQMVVSKWNEIKQESDIQKFFEELTSFMFFVSDEIDNPKASILLTDTISWMVNILRPRIYKITAKKDFVPTKPKEMVIVKDIKPIPKAVIPYGKAIIDGDLGEWEGIQKLSNFLTYDKGEVFEPETYVKVQYDDENLYVLFVCNEPQINEVKKFSGPRDTRTYLGDSVEIFILKDEQTKKYYHFVIGIDGTIYDEEGYDSRWNGDINAKVKIEDDCWYVETKINLKQMGIEPKVVKELKVNFNRNRWKGDNPQYSCWSVTYGSYHTVERFGTIIFEE